MTNLYRKGDFVEIITSPLNKNGTIYSMIENYGNVWKIIEVNTANNAYYTLKNVNKKIKHSLGIYSVFPNDVKKIENDDSIKDFINSFRNAKDFHEEKGIKDAEQQSNALEKFSKGEMDYATMRDMCG